ncbi:MAG: helix-turn-helix transcriptional regulator [Bryobacterales bacterium]|nr:helix-turn-helix transcriptional regulator [Bryobacterales bacterium]
MKDTAAQRIQQIGKRVKEQREAAGLSLDQLSRLSGVSKAMLSQVERSRANPTVVVLLKIASGLGCPLDALLGPGTGGTPIDVVRCDDTRAIYTQSHECTIRTLSPLGTGKNLEFYEILLAGNAALRSQPHFRRTEEYLTVTRGKVRVVSEENTALLRKGDSAHYRADVPHAIENAGAAEARVYLVVKYGMGD